jgi:leucyl/phenylalanyl-tRNA--protein transferase
MGAVSVMVEACRHEHNPSFYNDLMHSGPHLPWLEPGAPFPDPEQAWDDHSPAPGLLAAGAELTPQRLIEAYGMGIFPWFSPGQPVLWFSTHPRMVLRATEFQPHHSLAKKIRKLLREQRLVLRFDHDFALVMRHCAHIARPQQKGTWIGADMMQAYAGLHARGLAQSITTWIDGELAGGLYAVTLGQMVYGESMFSLQSDGSKIALCALACWALENGLPLIDCQQQTQHMQFMGARPIDRKTFLQEVQALVKMPQPAWSFQPHLWHHLGLCS